MTHKLDSLRQRELALRSKIAEEIKLAQRREWRNFDRLRTIIGGALVRMAEQNPDFKRMLTQSLGAAELTPAERDFLNKQGWQ